VADSFIRIEGLTDLRRDLKAIDKGLPRELNKATREAMAPVARRASTLAPKDSGQLASSLRPFSTAKRAGIRSRLPYAGPVHWGWAARGIEPNPFAVRAAEDELDNVVDAIGDAIDDLARRHGFR